MISDQLGHIISEELERHPLVVVPSFGGFVKDRIDAHIDEHRSRVHPPKTTVIFNPRLEHNDGILITSIAQQLDLSYEKADDWMTDAIAELRFRLFDAKKVELAGFGTLNMTQGRSIEFEYSQQPSMADEYYGLRPISVVPVEKDNLDKVREMVASDGPVVRSIRTLPVKQIVRYGAAAVAFGFLIWLPIQKGALSEGKMLVQQLNPFPDNTPAVYRSREFDENWIARGFEKNDPLADKYDAAYLSLYLNEDSETPIIVKTDALPSDALGDEPIVDNPNTVQLYKVIASSFATRELAAEYVAKMIKRGFSAEYAGKDKTGHLVAYGSYTSIDDAQKMLASVSLSNPEARILAGK